MRRALAFTGVAPLGSFFAVHMITTATALGGSARFDRVFARNSPAITWFTIAFVLAPLAFHAVFGTVVALSGTRRIGAPLFAAPLRRAAAIVTFVFLVWHVADVPMRVWIAGLPADSLHDLLAAQLSSTALGFPFRAVFTMFGLAATAFHFSTSMWTFCTTWGVTPTFRSQRISAWSFGVAGSLLFLIGARTVVFFATGSRLLSPDRPAFSRESLDGVLPHPACPSPESASDSAREPAREPARESAPEAAPESTAKPASESEPAHAPEPESK